MKYRIFGSIAIIIVLIVLFVMFNKPDAQEGEPQTTEESQ